jgi:hypothetical protein
MSEIALFDQTKKWIQHPMYFVFCLALGLFAWSFSFHAKKPIAEALQFSLTKNAQYELYVNEQKFMSRFPASGAAKPYKKIPKRFRSNPAFQLIEKLKHVVE